ncbi:MAG: phosphoglycerate kinase [Deltaproteobacteria bacterium]|jgi:phosphoglycerate kinase|nr:phosphoglycerate kinase [Deltaproteobacteria bacterium]
MAARTIAELDLQGRRVFIRVDFDVSYTPAGGVSDATRIRATLPTIAHAIERGARVVLAAHVGRPKGRSKPELSLLPVAAYLAEALGRDVFLTDEPAGDGAKKVVNDLRDGCVAMLENLRFSPGEEANDETFARALASYADVYANEAFRTAHHAHASTAGMVKYVASKGMGFLMDREVKMLGKVVGEVERPFVAVIGGSQVTEKIGLLESLLGRADTICLGGAMANTFLAAQGASLGRSLVEAGKLPIARAFLAKAETSGVRIVLPRDLAVAEEATSETSTIVAAARVPDDQAAFDIGPESVAELGALLSRARTVFWNGPMGVFESPAFAAGTLGTAKAIALVIGGTTVVGGADTATAVERAGVRSTLTHVSAGGDAALAFVAGKKLPGLAALET